MTAMGAETNFLVAPRVPAPLDPDFRPAALACRAYRQQIQTCGGSEPVGIALEQADKSVFHFSLDLLPQDHPAADANWMFLERTVKLALWSRGGFRIWFQGPPVYAERLQAHFRDSPTGQFDSRIVAERVFGQPLEVMATRELPPPRSRTMPLGRHLDGCRIGFDLGGSDRKVAAVREGKVVFSDETPWNPYPQSDPSYHYEGIMDSLRRAARHLPRVDAIGGSAAGVYVNNQVKVASLFRGVAPDLFERRVKNMFLDVRRAWHDVPLEVVNDGEVTALAGSMALGEGAVLGISLGTSTAGGYVTPEGAITSWLNELAFVPVDYRPDAPRDEWSGDVGCGVQYLSQQAVGRLVGKAGIEVDPARDLAGLLEHVQKLIADDDPRARRVYETVGVYLGYAVAHLAGFYDFRHVLVLGRVTSGPGGDVIIAKARQVLSEDFPAGNLVSFHMPDETQKRHGQAIAAASLPMVERQR
jgi:predicted NBD/HSP70 family sugar kinase